MSDSGERPKIVQDALDFYQLVATDVESAQRARELEDLKFARGWREDQWPGAVIAERSGITQGSNIAVAPRPCLTINKTRQPIQQINNQAKAAHLSLHFSPNDDEADKDTAEEYEDIARAIQTDSRAQIARMWAFERASKCGRGYYRIVTEYASQHTATKDAPASAALFDQVLVYKRILNQFSVYLDPFATEPDWSDGEKALITEDISWARYKRDYNKRADGNDSELATMSDGELMSLGDDAPNWVGGEKEHRSVRIAEYFYVEYEDRELLTLNTPSGETVYRWRDELPKELPKELIQDSRKVPRRMVKWAKVNAAEVLDKGELDCCYIPIIPVIADEDNVGGERSFQGIIRPAMDAQRLYNFMKSAQAETIGLAPKSPWIMAEGQDEGYEQMWAQANIRNFPTLKYRPVTLLGSLAPPPQRDVQEPAIQAITMAMAGATDDIHATTGVPPVALGQLDPHERSGKAIKALQAVSEQGTSGYLDNLTSMSMVLEGKILQSWIPKVYDRPGRIVAAVGADDQRRSVMLKQPFVPGPNGRPIEAPPDAQQAKTIDLSKGEYTVTATVGKSYSTKREQAASELGALIGEAPEMLLPLLGDLYVGELDGPGMRQAADRLKKQAEKQGVIEAEGQETPPIPPAVQQQLEQMKQMIDLLSKELNAKSKIIETDTVKANQDLAKTELELTVKKEIEFAKIQADLEKAQLTAGHEAALATMQAQIAEIQAQFAHARDLEAMQAGQAHEAAMAGAQMGHEEQMQANQPAPQAGS